MIETAAGPGREGTLSELLVERAETAPDRVALVLIEEDGSERALSRRRLLEEALAWARGLHATGVRPRDLVIVVLPHSLDLFAAFWGTLCAGATVCIYPPSTPRLDQGAYLRQLRAACDHAEARLLVTSTEWAAGVGAGNARGGWACLGVEAVRGRAGESSDHRALVPHGGHEPAVMLHTSGSSGAPRAVVFTHRQMLDHTRALGQAIDVQPDDVIVSWLPLHHDMGVYASLVLPAVAGVPAVAMSPAYWIRRPGHLLRAVSHHRGTVTWMPNFAYHHCVRRIQDREIAGLDLGSWRAIFNSAEPVKERSHEEFLSRFSPLGLRPCALLTGYGMTEVGGISISPPGRRARVDWVERESLQARARAQRAPAGAEGAVSVVSCGVPMPTLEVKIVDDMGSSLGEREVGEIAVRGPFVFDGYHRRPDLSGTVRHAGYFHTGDMGYMADGELYVCGRRKDVIITGGVNVYPQDLEAIANRVDGVAPGRTVAFGLMEEDLGTEAIVLVCELRDGQSDRDEVEREIRRRVTRELDITLSRVLLVGERGWVLKTPGGKVARGANRRKYVESSHKEAESRA